MKENGWEVKIFFYFENQKTKFLIDGFPRNQDNVDGWAKVIGDEADVKGILYFNCSEVRERELKNICLGNYERQNFEERRNQWKG